MTAWMPTCCGGTQVGSLLAVSAHPTTWPGFLLLSPIDEFAISNRGGIYVIEEADGATLVAASRGPCIDEAATALRTRGEPTTLPIELLVGLPGHLRHPASGRLSSLRHWR
jgi:hypothetical protein